METEITQWQWSLSSFEVRFNIFENWPIVSIREDFISQCLETHGLAPGQGHSSL